MDKTATGPALLSGTLSSFMGGICASLAGPTVCNPVSIVEGINLVADSDETGDGGLNEFSWEVERFGVVKLDRHVEGFRELQRIREGRIDSILGIHILN